VKIGGDTDASDTILHVEYDFPGDMRTVVCSLLDLLADWEISLNATERLSPK
jgi:hypothetical protein